MEEMHDIDKIISRIDENMILFTINKKKKLPARKFNLRIKKIIKENQIKMELMKN